MEQLKNEGELDLDLEQKFDDLNLNDAKDERRKDPSVEELFRIDYLSTKVSFNSKFLLIITSLVLTVCLGSRCNGSFKRNPPSFW